MRRQRIAERAVAVRSLAQVVTVDPDLAVAVHAVEVDERQASTVRHGNRECLAIPTDSAWQRATADAGRMRLTEFSLDAPVVGQVERAPSGIVEGGVVGARDVT